MHHGHHSCLSDQCVGGTRRISQVGKEVNGGIGQMTRLTATTISVHTFHSLGGKLINNSQKEPSTIAAQSDDILPTFHPKPQPVNQLCSARTNTHNRYSLGSLLLSRSGPATCLIQRTRAFQARHLASAWVLPTPRGE